MRKSFTSFAFAVAVCVAVALAACVSHNDSQSGFGPARAAQSVPVQIPATATKSSSAYAYADVRSVAMQVTRSRVDVPEAGVRNSEPSLAVSAYANATEGDQLVVAWMQMRPGANNIDTTLIKSAQSDNNGVNWSSTGVVLTAVGAADIGFDPSVSADPETGFAAIAGMTRNFTNNSPANPIWVARKSSRSANFGAPMQLSGATSTIADRQWLSSAHVNGERLTVLMATGVPRYWVSIGDQPFQQIEQALNCKGVYPAVSATGELHIACFELGNAGQSNRYIHKRTVGGVFGPAQVAHAVAPDSGSPTPIFSAIPGSFRFSYYPVFAVDSARDRVYFPTSLLNESVTAGNVDIVLTVSENGQSFSAPIVVSSNAVPGGDQFAPAISVDPQGGIHLAYFDTSAYPQTDNASSALLDVIYAYSVDGGSTWVQSKVNETAIDTNNTPWSYPPNGSVEQFIGDYISIASSPTAAYISYPRTNGDQLGLEVARVERPADPSLFANGFEL